MASRTFHVYRSEEGGWVLQRTDHKAVATFEKRQDALDKGRLLAKGLGAGQVVLHYPDGRMRNMYRYRLPKIQRPRVKSQLGTENIARAVAEVVRARLLASA